MASEERIHAAVRERPETCSEVWWGRSLSAVRVDLPAATEELVADLIGDAWARRAPRRLLGR